MNFFTKNIKTNNEGLSLVEILVVISIFVFISIAVVARLSVFNNSISTTNLAYDIALSIREAQSFATNVRGVGTNFDTGYGLHFRRGTDDSYEFFADIDNSKVFGPGPSDVILDMYEIGGDHRIYDICGTSSSLGTLCFSANDFLHFNIVFERPNLDAYIRSRSPSFIFDSADITIVSSSGDSRIIRIFSTGQISIVRP